jgi:hypothetical protein
VKTPTLRKQEQCNQHFTRNATSIGPALQNIFS